ncbi:hypothetical protein V8C43DRAFT_276268 [Trichoderma afarasin]
MGCLVWTCSNNVGVANSLVATGRFSRSFSLLLFEEFEEFTPVDPLLAIGALVSASNGGGRQAKTANQNKFSERSRPLHIATQVNKRKKATSAYKCPRNEFDSPRTLAHSAATSWALLVGQTNGAAL